MLPTIHENTILEIGDNDFAFLQSIKSSTFDLDILDSRRFSYYCNLANLANKISIKILILICFILGILLIIFAFFV